MSKYRITFCDSNIDASERFGVSGKIHTLSDDQVISTIMDLTGDTCSCRIITDAPDKVLVIDFESVYSG